MSNKEMPEWMAMILVSYVFTVLLIYYYVFTMTYCERQLFLTTDPLLALAIYASAVATSSSASPSTFWGVPRIVQHIIYNNHTYIYYTVF